MGKDFKRLTDFLVGLGVEKIDHTQKSYLAHLIGVYRLMESQGCTEELCRAGMFHSIYGTERFRGFTLPPERRPEVRALIGERAERLAHLNCFMERATLDRAGNGRGALSYQAPHRRSGGAAPAGFRRPVSGSPVRLAGAGAALAPGLGPSPSGFPAHGRAAGWGGEGDV